MIVIFVNLLLFFLMFQFIEMNPNQIQHGKNFPNELVAYIEVQKNTRTKYEYDEKSGLLVLDRILHSAVFYPHNYGFVPQTLCGDGDPLDVLVMTSEPLLPGTLCHVRPICHLIMEDEKGADEKLLAVSLHDPYFNEIHHKKDISEHILKEISVFFETYKILEKKKWVKVKDWSSEEETISLIKQTHNDFIEQVQPAEGNLLDVCDLPPTPPNSYEPEPIITNRPESDAALADSLSYLE